MPINIHFPVTSSPKNHFSYLYVYVIITTINQIFNYVHYHVHYPFIRQSLYAVLTTGKRVRAKKFLYCGFKCSITIFNPMKMQGPGSPLEAEMFTILLLQLLVS